VVDAEDVLKAMIARLGNSERVAGEGMAIAERIVTGTESSPLCSPAAPGTLRRLALLATAALEPGAGELPIAA
jgi:hypothetical protein